MGSDRWSEWVSALGPAVRHEAPQARDKQERGQQDPDPLTDQEQRPEVCLVAPPSGWKDGVDRKLTFTVKKHYTVFENELLWLG